MDSLSYFDVNEVTSIRVATFAGYFSASPTSEDALCNADIDTILQDWTFFAVDSSGEHQRPPLLRLISILRRMKQISATISYCIPTDIYCCCKILSSLCRASHSSLELTQRPGTTAIFKEADVVQPSVL